jgi:hypothetical protein
MAWISFSPSRWYEWLLVASIAPAIAIYAFQALRRISWLSVVPIFVATSAAVVYAGPPLIFQLLFGLTVFLWLYSLAMMDELTVNQPSDLAWWASPRLVRTAYSWGIKQEVRVLDQDIQVLFWLALLLPFLGGIPFFFATRQ